MTRKINREIIRLAIPNIISNITVPLLSSVDTALMGRMSAAHIGAVGIGSMIFNFVYWNFGFLRMGTTGMTAQAFGKGSNPGIINTFSRAILLSLILAAMILILQVPFGRFGFQVMNVVPGQMDLVGEYFYTRIWAAPATLSLYACMGWFFGLQNAVYPLILTVIINVVNIGLSYYFVINLNMGARGAALGTVLAQYTGLICAAVFIASRYRNYFKYFVTRAVIQFEPLKRFLMINGDIFIRTFCLTFAFGFFYSKSSTNGEMILAANVILLQYINWMSYGIDGIAFAAESLIGKYFGAGDQKSLMEALRLSFLWGFAFAGLYSLVFGIFGIPLLGIFTNQPSVIDAAVPFLIWMIAFPIISFACYIWDGVYIGLTASRSMRNSMIPALICYLVFYYATASIWPKHGLWASLLFFMAIRAVIQTYLFSKHKFKLV